MSTPAANLQHCPICASELDHDGVCLACAFSDALEPVEQTPVTSTFRPSPPRSKQPQYQPFGKPALPCQFASHRLIREIASGGMGIVYEAEDLKLKRLVALKMIRSAAHASVEEKARFRAEAEAAAKLEHPAIVPIYEIGEAQGLPYFTMRLVEGGSLAQKLAASPGQMTEKDAAVFMSRCARAVHHAHEHGVLHRDLTPGNILLDVEGRPLITDFGVAKRLDVEVGLTRTTAQLGTPHYMSPEQAAGGSKNITTASDVWALGVILFQLVSGRLPFEGAHQVEVMQKVLHEEPTSLQGTRIFGSSGTFRGGVSTDFRTIISKCLEKNLTYRISSAAFLADELDRFVAGVPIHSRPASSWMQLRKWVMRHPAVAAMLVLCLAIATVSTAAVLSQWRSALIARDAAVAAQARTSRVLYRSTIANAIAAVQAGQTGDARRLMASIVPVADGTDLRGPEWYMLSHLCAGDDVRRPDGSPAVGPLTGTPDAFGWMNVTTRFAVAYSDGRLELWDPYQMGISETLSLPPLNAGSALLTSGTKVRIRFSHDDRLSLWNHASVIHCVDHSTGKVLFREELNKPDFGWLADGRFYLARRAEEREKPEADAWIIDPRSETRQPLPIGISAPIAISADGNTVLGSTLSGPVQVWLDKEKLSEPPQLILSKQGRPSNIALSPAGDMAAISSFSGSDSLSHLFIYALPSGELLYQQSAFDPVVALEFHPKLNCLAIAADRPNWEYLPLDDQRHPKFSLRTQKGHSSGVRHLSISANGHFAMTYGADSQLLLWEHPFSVPASCSTFIAPSVKGRTPLFGPSDDVFLVSATTGPRRYEYGSSHNVVRVLTSHQAFAWAPDARLYTWLPTDRSICCVDYAVTEPTAKTLWSIPCPEIPADAQLIDGGLTSAGDKAVLCTTRSLTVVNVQDQSATTVLVRGGSGRTGHNAFALGPRGRHAALVGFSLHPQIRSLDDPGHSVQLAHDGLQDISVAFSTSGHWLLAGNEDGQVRVWSRAAWDEGSPASGQLLHKWQTHIGPVTGVILSPDGRTLYTSGDTLLKVWNVEGDRLTLRASFPVPSPRHWLRFSPDGRWLHHAGIGTPAERWPVSK